MNEAEIANILMQIVEGLLYLKVNNIVHRDLSLANILLTSDFKVKIADFGLATEANEKHNTLCGTPNFMPPEVVSRTTHGIQVDVWGVGCILYAMLVGQPPFEAGDNYSTWDRVLKEDAVIPHYISYEAKDLLGRLLQKNQNERMQIEQVLKHPFMLKHLQGTSHPTTHLYAGASVDSGLLTMSSGLTSMQNVISGKMEHLRPRSEDRYFNQSNTPAMANNIVFDTMKKSNSAFSLYNRYDSLYSEPVTTQQPLQSHQPFQTHQPHQPLQSQSNEFVNRMGNMGLVTHADKPIFGGLPSNPAFEYGLNANNGPKMYSNTHATPLQENLYYGMQSNQMQHYEHVLLKQQSVKSKLSVPPLNSERLLPTRHRTKTAILSILSTGEVVVELIKFNEKFNDERVTDVCRISKDGQRIIVYQPDAGRYVFHLSLHY